MKRPTTLTVTVIDAPGGNARVTITPGDQTRTGRDPWGFLFGPDFNVKDVVTGDLLSTDNPGYTIKALEAIAVTAVGIHRGKA